MYFFTRFKQMTFEHLSIRLATPSARRGVAQELTDQQSTLSVRLAADNMLVCGDVEFDGIRVIEVFVYLTVPGERSQLVAHADQKLVGHTVYGHDEIHRPVLWKRQ